MKTWLMALSFVFAASAAIADDVATTTAPAETTVSPVEAPAEVEPATTEEKTEKSE